MRVSLLQAMALSMQALYATPPGVLSKVARFSHGVVDIAKHAVPAAQPPLVSRSLISTVVWISLRQTGLNSCTMHIASATCRSYLRLICLLLQYLSACPSQASPPTLTALHCVHVLLVISERATGRNSCSSQLPYQTCLGTQGATFISQEKDRTVSGQGYTWP